VTTFLSALLQPVTLERGNQLQEILRFGCSISGIDVIAPRPMQHVS
jgi:hypothetical protein